MNRKLLYAVVILLSMGMGGYLTYIVEGLNYGSIVTRSIAILLFPSIAVAIASYGYRLIKKKKVSSSAFDKIFLLFWGLGVAAEFITYFLL